jgi:hypothetical protein
MSRITKRDGITRTSIALAFLLGCCLAIPTNAQNAEVEAAQKVSQSAEEKADKTAEDAQSSAENIQKQLDDQKSSGAQTQATLTDMQRMLEQQQKLIEAQKKEIDRQQETLNKQSEQLKTTADLLTNMQTQIDQMSTQQTVTLSDDDVAMRKRLSDLESQVSKIPDDPSSMLADENFPGAIRVPGSAGSFKIGGYVKANIVKNFDPLQEKDRFIVGSIPVTDTDATAAAKETSLTANQSRINIDYRQQTDQGNLRAFIEGDFTEDDDTFRLRHAYGQFRDVLAGKTWSAFYDGEAAPEEVDFEGINGRVIVRQTQVRYFPQIGKDWRWMISIEDPAPEVTGGDGVSDLPDIVTSIRRDWFKRWHMKTALIVRQLKATNNEGVTTGGQECTPITGTAPGDTDIAGCTAIANAGAEDKETAWGVTASGRVKVPWFNEDDNLIFQLNYGDGIGRYINDLSSINSLGIDGGQDAVIDPATGKMDALSVFGGYLAFQHWWADQIRSTFLISAVNVDNEDSQTDDAYHKTRRASANLIWSPIPNVDIGTEFMWGERENNNGESGNATQLQFEALFRF